MAGNLKGYKVNNTTIMAVGSVLFLYILSSIELTTKESPPPSQYSLQLAEHLY